MKVVYSGIQKYTEKGLRYVRKPLNFHGTGSET